MKQRHQRLDRVLVAYSGPEEGPWCPGLGRKHDSWRVGRFKRCVRETITRFAVGSRMGGERGDELKPPSFGIGGSAAY